MNELNLTKNNFSAADPLTPMDQDNCESSKSAHEEINIKQEIDDENYNMDTGEENKCKLKISTKCY